MYPQNHFICIFSLIIAAIKTILIAITNTLPPPLSPPSNMRISSSSSWEAAHLGGIDFPRGRILETSCNSPAPALPPTSIPRPLMMSTPNATRLPSKFPLTRFASCFCVPSDPLAIVGNLPIDLDPKFAKVFRRPHLAHPPTCRE